MTNCRLLLAFSLALLLMGRVVGQDYAPGTETRLEIPGFENQVIVYVPQDYTADREWPIVHHYHGTNGKPTVGIPRLYTRGKGFVIVGMDFTERGNSPVTKEFYQNELKAIADTHRLVGQHVRIDGNRVYVGGFSKGGWVSSRLAESYMPDLSGAYVLGAGQAPYTVDRPIQLRKKRSLYIGVGQLEINYPWGVMAIDHFDSLGFQVTFEAYPGLGHSMPTQQSGADPFRRVSTHFLQWWDVERHRDQPAPLREPVQNWFGAIGRLAADTEVSTNARYLAVYRSRRAPFYHYLNQEQRQALAGWLKELSAVPSVQKEITAQSRFFQLIERENSNRTFSTLLSVATEYHEAYARNAETYHGALAGLCSERLRKQLSDTGRWRFSDPEQKRRTDELLASNPIPVAPEKELVEQIRAVEKAIAESGL